MPPDLNCTSIDILYSTLHCIVVNLVIYVSNEMPFGSSYLSLYRRAPRFEGFRCLCDSWTASIDRHTPSWKCRPRTDAANPSIRTVGRRPIKIDCTQGAPCRNFWLGQSGGPRRRSTRQIRRRLVALCRSVTIDRLNEQINQYGNSTADYSRHFNSFMNHYESTKSR